MFEQKKGRDFAKDSHFLGVKLFIFKLVSTIACMARHCAANSPRKRERQDGDRPGHTGLSESLIWDSDDMPSLQHPLSRALELYIGEEGAYVNTDCNEKKCAR